MLINENSQMNFETFELLKKEDQAGCQVIETFSSSAASKSFEQEVRQMVSLEFFVKQVQFNLDLYYISKSTCHSLN